MIDADLLSHILDLEAEWASVPEEPDEGPAPASPARARPGEPRDPAWEPVRSGQKIDRESDAYREAAAMAMTGLPPFADLEWLQAQLLDRGAAAAGRRGRFALKLEFSDAPVEKCTRAGLRAMKRERWVNLSEPKAFWANIRRGRASKFHDRVHREAAAWLIADARAEDARREAGAPPCLLGRVSCRFAGAGTVTYPAQFALVTWASGGAPFVLLTNLTGDYEDFETMGVGMWEPPAVNRDGSERRSPFVAVGNWFSPRLQARIDAGKAAQARRRGPVQG